MQNFFSWMFVKPLKIFTQFPEFDTIYDILLKLNIMHSIYLCYITVIINKHL